MKCIRCNRELPDGAKFCKECGAKQGIVCSVCGTIADKDSKFCMECGADLMISTIKKSKGFSITSIEAEEMGIKHGFDIHQPNGTGEYCIGLTWSVGSSGYNGNATQLVIPAVIEGQKVTRIFFAAFSRCNSLEQVTISEGITRIDSRAFTGCKRLKSVIIPSSMDNLSTSSFEDCDNLEVIYYRGSENQWKDLYKASIKYVNKDIVDRFNKINIVCNYSE